MRDAIERLSLNRKAIQMTRGLNKLDESKRQEVIRCLLEYAEAAGFFDQLDAFNDTTDRIVALAARLSAKLPNRERGEDATMAALN